MRRATIAAVGVAVGSVFVAACASSTAPPPAPSPSSVEASEERPGPSPSPISAAPSTPVATPTANPPPSPTTPENQTPDRHAALAADPPGCIDLLDTVAEIQRDVARFRDAYNASDAAGAELAGETLSDHFFLLDDDDQCLHGATTTEISIAAQQVNFHIDDADLIRFLTAFGVDGWNSRLSTFLGGGVDFDRTFNGLHDAARNLADILACYPNSRVGQSELASVANADPSSRAGCDPSPADDPLYIARDPATFRAWTRAAFEIRLGRSPSEEELQRISDTMAEVHREHHQRLLSDDPVQRGVVARFLSMFD